MKNVPAEMSVFKGHVGVNVQYILINFMNRKKHTYGICLHYKNLSFCFIEPN